MKTPCNRRLSAVFGAVLLVLVLGLPALAKSRPPVVLATTFPIYQITRNVVQGGALSVDLMLPSTLGCPHDYALSPRDMMKLGKARVLVINGLGMEEFLHAALKKAGPSLKVIDSSKGITSLITDEYGNQGHRHKTRHDHDQVNPHLFVSPGMAGLLAVNIANGLSKIDPKNAAVYQENARAYGERMAVLDQRVRALGKRLVHRQIMTQHGVFDYLARDMGLTIAAVLASHGVREPSASEMLSLAKTIRTKKIRAIFIEPGYPSKAAKALSKETGIPVVVLDPGSTGPKNADPAYYDILMDRNLKTLESVLGGSGR